jgi:hypothetical protein
MSQRGRERTTAQPPDRTTSIISIMRLSFLFTVPVIPLAPLLTSAGWTFDDYGEWSGADDGNIVDLDYGEWNGVDKTDDFFNPMPEEEEAVIPPADMHFDFDLSLSSKPDLLPPLNDPMPDPTDRDLNSFEWDSGMTPLPLEPLDEYGNENSWITAGIVDENQAAECLSLSGDPAPPPTSMEEEEEQEQEEQIQARSAAAAQCRDTFRNPSPDDNADAGDVWTTTIENNGREHKFRTQQDLDRNFLLKTPVLGVEPDSRLCPDWTRRIPLCDSGFAHEIIRPHVEFLVSNLMFPRPCML